jgi:uncharacterized protein
MVRFAVLMTIGSLASAAHAQRAEDATPRIMVSGTGTVRTMPDMATLTFRVRADAATADAATRALVAKRDAIAGGIASLAARTSLDTGSLSVIEARDKACQTDWQARERLAEGDCAVRGYIASMDISVRLHAIGEAGTITGLVARLGGSEVRLANFALSDVAAARRKATTAALADARAQAETIVAGEGARLGRIILVTDGQNWIRVSAASAPSLAASPPPPPPPPPPPVAVNLAPQPVETVANLTVTYAIAP